MEVLEACASLKLFPFRFSVFKIPFDCNAECIGCEKCQSQLWFESKARRDRLTIDIVETEQEIHRVTQEIERRVQERDEFQEILSKTEQERARAVCELQIVCNHRWEFLHKRVTIEANGKVPTLWIDEWSKKCQNCGVLKESDEPEFEAGKQDQADSQQLKRDIAAHKEQKRREKVALESGFPRICLAAGGVGGAPGSAGSKRQRSKSPDDNPYVPSKPDYNLR